MFAQKVRSQVKTEAAWSVQVIPNAFISEVHSKTFLKKITRIITYNICYARNILPENIFEKVEIEGVEVAKVQDKCQHPDFLCFETWLTGAFEALDKNYLREIFINILKNNESKEIIERYRFAYNYMGNDDILRDILPTVDNVKSSTADLLKNVYILQNHTPLPENFQFTMELTYYDIAPKDYEPPSFQKRITNASQEIKTRNLRIGKPLITPYCKMQLYAVVQIKIESGGGDAASNISTDIDGTELENELETSGKEDESSDDDLGVEFACICKTKINIPTTFKIRCTICNTIQHGCCYGALSRPDLPKRHICVECCKSVNRPGPELKRLLKNIDDQKLESCFRMILTYCQRMNKTPVSFMTEFDFTKQEKQMIMQHLCHYRILGEGPEKSRVNSASLESTIKYAFTANQRKLIPSVKSIQEDSDDSDFMPKSKKFKN